MEFHCFPKLIDLYYFAYFLLEILQQQWLAVAGTLFNKFSGSKMLPFRTIFVVEYIMLPCARNKLNRLKQPIECNLAGD